MDASLSAETPCKVNLFLSVDGRRPDGYHLISTLFLPLHGLSDRIEISFDCEPGIKAGSDLEGLPSGMDNICAKAAMAYFAAAGLAPQASIKITKRIPVAAGLGGGSSDAAATLLLLERHFNALGPAALHGVAAKIGADVAFFLNPVASTAQGVGEQLKALDFTVPPLPVLLVFPRFPISAAWAYRNLDWTCAKADGRSLENAVAALRAGDIPGVAAMLRNDLSHAVRRKFPLTGIIERGLLEAGALGAQVSGSGSSVFAIFKDVAARDCAKRSLAERPDWNAFDLFAV